MNLKSNIHVHVYLILLCVLSQGFGRSVDVQGSTYYGEDTSDASDLEEVEDDSEDIDLNSSRGQDDLEERLNKLYSKLPPNSPETSQQREYSPQQDANFPVSNTSNPFAEDDLNSAYLQNNSKMGSIDVKFDSGKLNAGNSTQPSFVKTFKTINLKQEPVKEATGNEGEFSDTDYTGPGEENYHDSSANGLEIGESLETHKNNVEKTKIVQGENGAPKKLKIEENEVKQIFHWNSKTTPAPVEDTNSPNVDAVLEKIRTLDEDVLAGEKYLAQSLQGVKERMRNLQETAEKFQPLDQLSARKLMNVTLTAAEEAIWNMCIKPIRDKLSVPKWSDWSPWGRCTLTCGQGGYSLRHRNCLSESQRRCLGNSFDIRPCDMEICPAIWLSWGHWSHCSASCDHGLRVRTRTCLTSNIKLHCMGSTAEVKDCFDQKCPVPMKVDELNTSNEENTTGKENRSKDENTSIDENISREENIQSEGNSSMEDRDLSGTDERQAEDEEVYPESSPDYDERDRYLDGKSVRGKARKETMLSVNRAVEDEQFSHPAVAGPLWSSWTGWSVCKECGISNRDRKRICLNSTSRLPLESSFCSGAELELSPCSASSCPLEREFPNAPRISEGESGELKCEVRSDESPQRVYWITPLTRHIMHQQPDRRVHMAGTSLVVTKARFSDQGKYQCVLMFGKGQHRVQSAPLIVETCVDHHCKNGGECLTSPDPQFDTFKHYQCKCPASFDGPFCQNSLRGNKYIAPIIISVLCLMIAFALCLFLVLRSMKKKKKKNSEGKIWEKLGIQTYDKKIKKKSRDNSDVTNTSVVSNDDSFVEVTADDLEDYDHYEMPQESGSSGFYKTEDGYVVSPLKYPSPRQKLTYGLVSQNDEGDYIEMESLPEQKRHMRKIKFSDEDAEAFYENVPHSEAPLYENVPKGKAGASGGKPSPQKRKQRPTPEEVIDLAAEEIAQKCLKELQNQRVGKAGGQQSPQVTAPHRQSPNKGEIRTPTRVSHGQAQRASPSPAPRVTGYRVPAPESTSYDDQGYPLSKILAVKDKQQEAEFLKHFGGSFVPKMQSPNTSTPKKEQPVSGKKVILPSDILNTTPKEDLSVNKVKKNLAKELMIITSQNVIGQQEQTPEVRDQENISNNGQTQAIPSECEIFYDESSYHSVDPQSDFSSRRESFLSANSASVRTLPDVDGTISFPKLSGQHTQEDTGSGNQYLPNTELFPNLEGSGVFTHTEGSVYLSDYHYTPDPSELYTSPSSNAQDSEDEDEGEDEDEDESTESESSSHNSMALRYKPHHQ